MNLNNIKKILPYATLVLIIIGLITYVWADTKEEIKSKASYETVMMMLEADKVRRAEDKIKEQRAYEEKCEQNKINNKLLKSVQMLLIKQEIRDKKGD